MKTRRKPQSVYQYEPLVTPSSWKGEERQFVVRLTQLLDQLFARKTSASVSVDTTGMVKSVNNVQPDDDGNIPLTGANVPVSSTDTRKVSVAVAQNGNTVKTMTAQEFEALTTEQKAALYAQGVRVVAVESDLDPDSLTDMQRFAAFAHPVGEIVHLTVPTNPATIWGIGTWESYMPGRVLIGAGTADSGTVYEAGATGGEETHTLTVAEMPSHTHQGGFKKVTSATSGYDFARPVDYAYDGTYRLTLATGGSESHNIMQPYVAVYRWLRVA